MNAEIYHQMDSTGFEADLISTLQKLGSAISEMILEMISEMTLEIISEIISEVQFQR